MNRVYLSAFYITTIWLSYCYTIPFGDFEGIPLYILFVPLMLIVLTEAIVPAMIIAAVLVGYECMKFFQPQFVPTLKGFVGLFMLAIVLSTCYYAVAQVRHFSDEQIGKWLRWILYIMFGSILIDQAYGYAFAVPSEYPHYFLPIYRRSGLLTEPSFVALFLAPFLFIAVNNYDLYKRYMGVASIGVIAIIVVICPSATITGILMLVMGTAALKYFLKGRTLGIAGSAVALVGVVLAIIFVPDVAERFNGVISGDADLASQNMTSLIFIKGRQMATYAITQQPLGVSFLDMRVLVPQSDAAYLNPAIRELNSDDGSSIMFKGVSELGILFVTLSLIALWQFLKAVVVDPGTSMYRSMLLAFQFTAFAHFMRGSSYFDGIVAVCLAVCTLNIFSGGTTRQLGYLSAFKRPAPKPAAPARGVSMRQTRAPAD